MLKNAGFEGDWEGHSVLIVPEGKLIEVGNIFVPAGWGVWYDNSGNYAQPEGRYTTAENPVRYSQGTQGFLLFNFARTGRHGLYQRVEGVEPGANLWFFIEAHGWSNHQDNLEDFPHPDDPKWSEGAGYGFESWGEGEEPITGDPQQDAKSNMLFRVGIDPKGGLDPNSADVVWGEGWHIYNAFEEVFVSAKAAGTAVTVFTECVTKWPFKHNDAYWDNAELTVWEPQEGCNEAREPYDRTVNVYDPAMGRDEYMRVCAAVWDTYGPQSIGPSTDDGFVGDGLGSKVIRFWHVEPDDASEYRAFGDKYYPNSGAVLEFVKGETGDPPPPPPPPVDKRPITRGNLGIHQLQNEPEGFAGWQGIGPPLYKAVDRIDQILRAWELTPEKYRPYLKLFFRKYHPEEGGFRYDAGKANFWINLVCNDLAGELARVGIPTNQVWVLGLNEVWDHDYNNNLATVAFDRQALIELKAWNDSHGTQFKYAASSMAVGNPQRPDEGGGEEIWQAILPLAQDLRDFAYNEPEAGRVCCFNYHAYGFIGGLEKYGPWLQWRWFYYYNWLKERGAAVPFFNGEGGHVGGVDDTQAVEHILGNRDDLTVVNIPGERQPLILALPKERPPTLPASFPEFWLNPGQGWVNMMSAPAAAGDLMRWFDLQLEEFNAANGYKAAYGLTPFQWGNRTDWRLFNHEGELAQRLTDMMLAAYE